VHHVLSFVEQIAAGGNAQMTFQWIPGHCEIEGNMRADSIAKDASTLSHSAAPWTLALLKQSSDITVPTSEVGWPSQQYSMPHYVNRDHFTLSRRTLLSRLHTGGHTPQLACYRNRIMRNQDQPEPATCHRCGQADETLVHLMMFGIGRCTQPPFQ